MSREGVGPWFGWAMFTATMILIAVPVAEAGDRRTGLKASHVGAMSRAASVVAPRPMLMEGVPS
jgi:hypothetical protein